MLTISELAGYAGVTVRTVRHYHQLGILSEPPRDELGHRRYDAQALVQLRRITALTSAGVPLRQVPRVLAADPDERRALVEQLDAELAHRQQELEQARERLQLLADDQDAALSPGLVELEASLRALGIDETRMLAEREMWLLSQLLYPELASQWLQQQLALLADNDYAELYRTSIAAEAWSSDDPRLEELARRNVAWTLAHRPQYEAWVSSWQADQRAAALVEAHFQARFQTPVHRRVAQLVEQLMAQQGLPTHSW